MFLCSLCTCLYSFLHISISSVHDLLWLHIWHKHNSQFLLNSTSFLCLPFHLSISSIPLWISASWSPPWQSLTPPTIDHIHMLIIKSLPVQPHLWGNPLAGHLCLSDKEQYRCFILTFLFLPLRFLFFYMTFIQQRMLGPKMWPSGTDVDCALSHPNHCSI